MLVFVECLAKRNWDASLDYC